MLEDGHESAYYRAVRVEVLNPKSITMGELYGEVNLLTLEWRDGVLGRLVRGAVSVSRGRVPVDFAHDIMIVLLVFFEMS